MGVGPTIGYLLLVEAILITLFEERDYCPFHSPQHIVVSDTRDIIWPLITRREDNAVVISPCGSKALVSHLRQEALDGRAVEVAGKIAEDITFKIWSK